MSVEYFTVFTGRAIRPDGELMFTRSSVYKVPRDMDEQELYAQVFTDACDMVDELDQGKIAVLFYRAEKNRLR